MMNNIKSEKEDVRYLLYEFNLQFIVDSRSAYSYQISSLSAIEANTKKEIFFEKETFPREFVSILAELFSPNNLIKYNKILNNNRKVEEKLFIADLDKYINLKFTPLSLNEAKFSLSYPSLDSLNFEALKNNLVKYSHLTENTTDGICILNKDFQAFFSSPKLKKMLGYSPYLPLDLHPFDVIYQNDLPRIIDDLKSLKKQDNATITDTCRLIKKNGNLIQVEITGKNCLNIKDIEGIIANIKDISSQENIVFKTSQAPSLVNDKLSLQKLINVDRLKKLLEIFYRFNKIPIGIVDGDGVILTSIGMTDICGKFHRLYKASEEVCTKSDIALTKDLKKGEIRIYKCLNNMNDLVTPIIVEDVHVANLFIGQFFFDDEVIDKNTFIQQAKKYNFDTDAYLQALEKVPILNRNEIIQVAEFYSDFIKIISELAYSQIKLTNLNHYLESREEKLKQITDNMTDVVFTADFDFNITYVSPSIERLTSFTVQEYLNLSIEDRYTPRAVKEIKEAIREELIKDENCANKNRSNINTLALYDKNKNIIIVSIHSKFLRDKSGKPFAIIANLRDITKEYKIEKKLEHQLELLSLLTSIAVDYINIPTENIEKSINITLAKIAKFVHADRAYIFTYDWNKKISTNTYEWVAEGISSEKDNLQAVPLEAMEYWPEMHKQGQTIIINDLKELSDYPNVQKMLGEQDIKSLITIPLMMGDQCVGFTGFDSVKSKYEYSSSERSILAIFAELLVNIHNRIKLENALRAEREKALSSDQLKSNLLKNISHEFRTPLNGIVGFSELLQQKSPDYETGNMANMIYSSAVRLNHVLDSIMLLTQLEDINNKTIVNLKTINVSKVISDVYLLFEEQFKSKNLTCSFEIEPNIYGDLDEKLFKQALIHLLNNALKFTHQGGIRLLCSSQADKIIIEIEDTGIGIPEESLKIIFSEFRQASEGYNRAYEGVGLGLTISKRIMDLMSGEISIKSRILEGSTFTITLPLSTYNKSLVREFEQIQEDISFN